MRLTPHAARCAIPRRSSKRISCRPAIPHTAASRIPPSIPIPTPDGFHDFLVALRQEVIAFGKPVAYVHGDSHYFRIDKPFLDSKGQRIANFTRVETFGDHQENG